MKMSPAGRKALMQREGVRLKAYKDSVGIPTVGVGHTSAAGPPEVKMGMTITAAECEEILSRDLVQFEQAVERAVKVPVSQGEFDALVSLAFNIGAPAFRKSSLVKKLNAGDRAGAGNAFLAWNKAGGEVLPGLAKRRAQERAQFLAAGAPMPPVRPLGLIMSETQTATTAPRPREPAPSASVGPTASSAEVTAIQNRLTHLGYRMVGKVDGLMGLRTKAALSAFQEANDLTVTGRLDDDTRAALWSDDAKPLPVDTARATATAKDLKPDSKIIQVADPLKKIAAGAGFSVAGLPAAIDAFSPYLETIQRVREVLDGVPGWVWGVAAGGLLLGCAYAAHLVIRARVQQHREGVTA